MSRNQDLNKLQRALQQCIPKMQVPVYQKEAAWELTHVLFEIFGGPSQDAKPEESTTIQTPETVSLDSSNLTYPHGALLEELDTLINFLTNARENLQNLYNAVTVGDPGPTVQENSDSYEIPKRPVRDNPQA